MDINGLNAAASSASHTGTTKRFQELQTEDFFKLLISELQSQDPLKPADNQQLFSQLSQIRQIDQSVTLNKTLDSLAGEQRFGATSGLIGHYISGTIADNSGQPHEVQGLVIGVRFENDGDAILELHNGNSIPASAVDQVTLVDNLPAELRDRLRTELAQLQGGSAGGSGSQGGGLTAKAIPGADPLSDKSLTGDILRAFAKNADSTDSFLSSLFKPQSTSIIPPKAA